MITGAISYLQLYTACFSVGQQWTNVSRWKLMIIRKTIAIALKLKIVVFKFLLILFHLRTRKILKLLNLNSTMVSLISCPEIHIEVIFIIYLDLKLVLNANRKDICLQILLLLFKYPITWKKKLYFDRLWGSCWYINETINIGEVNGIFPINEMKLL